jgi:hypothetical protein
MPLATIAGRVPVVKQNTKATFMMSPGNPFRGMWYIANDRKDYLWSDGNWHDWCEPSMAYWPTEAAALAFCREVAEREAGELLIEGRRAFVQEVDGGMGYIICDRDSGDCYSPPPYGWASKSSGVWPDYEGARSYAERCSDDPKGPTMTTTNASDEADIIGGFPVAQPNCLGCGKTLLLENAWMTDGCPCNHVLGVNNQNETRWRLLMTLQQRQAHALTTANERLERIALLSSPPDSSPPTENLDPVNDLILVSSRLDTIHKLAAGAERATATSPLPYGGGPPVDPPKPDQPRGWA